MVWFGMVWYGRSLWRIALVRLGNCQIVPRLWVVKQFRVAINERPRSGILRVRTRHLLRGIVQEARI